MNLNDIAIRAALIQKLNNQSIKPKAVIEELRVHNGNAIADVVALYNEAHCYEIKGYSDKIERVLTQASYYNPSFRKITLVTTKNHLQKASNITPMHWGIMLADCVNGNICITHIRKAKNNPEFNKELALLTLWKSEMLRILEENKHSRKPRDFLAQLISSTKKKSELSSNICSLLIDRHIERQLNSSVRHHESNMSIN